ncbi:hypothetical protein CPSG_00036 [Coccidioides posadasii str. Silveira]|uniref:Uncharacterized protein n=1 Tax=Coccidioides posadasii (strain RMSCC 757 / Silveira) TaxID=443226 RepID=E9CTJ2_COCPS|nr:hypothetical protein CPSG_00036 [Coccidioides posadasii str. Silveira]
MNGGYPGSCCHHSLLAFHLIPSKLCVSKSCCGERQLPGLYTESYHLFFFCASFSGVSILEFFSSAPTAALLIPLIATVLAALEFF